MTPELIKEPTPAQLVLRTERLHDKVFDTAIALVPDTADREQLEGEDIDAWSDRIEGALRAWERMWVSVPQAPDAGPGAPPPTPSRRTFDAAACAASSSPNSTGACAAAGPVGAHLIEWQMRQVRTL
ncbi:hypothetical protein [Kitasatospora sp. NPDC088346]|uniref:hypothetical protein n=1 Tax=Kitasatospora sp. NPDC088346 TaxID=3364073 RepID=UPI0038192CEF